jgi:hypothetical protein
VPQPAPSRCRVRRHRRQQVQGGEPPREELHAGPSGTEDGCDRGNHRPLSG